MPFRYAPQTPAKPHSYFGKTFTLLVRMSAMVNVPSGLVYLGLSLSITLVLASCSQPATSPATSETSITSATSSSAAMPSALDGVLMSNLVDEASKTEVRTALLAAGVPAESADRFFAQVDLYNQTVAKDSLLPDGFHTYSDDYPLDKLSNLWNTRFPEFIGTNCRINTFLLTEDLVTVNPQQSNADTSLLFMDEDAIAHAPDPLLSESEKEAFTQIFGRIKTTSEHNSQQHIADIKRYFHDLGITFTNQDIKIVSVFIHDTLDTPAHLFIGHIGLAVPHENGIMFIEKLAFDKPYQALKFRDYDQLNDYLRSLYDDGPDQEYSQPIIFTNNEVLSTP